MRPGQARGFAAGRRSSSPDLELLRAHADDGEGRLPKRWQQLWARQVSGERYVLCCIPFFAYNLALGDEGETGPATGKRYVVRRVTTPSGHYTFRVWFGQSTHPTIQPEVTDAVARLGGQTEWSSRNLLAIDTEAVAAQAVADWLWRRHQQGHLLYETGRMHEQGERPPTPG